jgi:hypothetical protein
VKELQRALSATAATPGLRGTLTGATPLQVRRIADARTIGAERGRCRAWCSPERILAQPALMGIAREQARPCPA